MFSENFYHLFQSRDEPQHISAAGCKDPRFKKILSLFDYVDEHFDLFNLYSDIDEFLNIKMLSVSSSYGRKGIGGNLVKLSVQYARDNKIPLTHVLCTSQYSARICERLGFEEKYKLQYIDYKVNGISPILPPPPHLAVQIFCSTRDF